MKTILQVVDRDGQVTAELPLDDSRVEINPKAGETYRLVVKLPAGQSDAGTLQISGPRAMRIEDDLIIDQVPAGYPVTVTDFFATCDASQACSVEFDLPGKQVAVLTATNEPLAAYAEGGFLMYSAAPTTTAAIPTPPEAESTFNWRPIAAVAGGLGIALAAGGSGSDPTDASAPVAPSLDTGASTNSPTPVFMGTAEPGSTVALTLSIGQNANQLVRYSTQADAQGNWEIDTLTAVPDSGTFPAGGIPADQPSSISIISTDSAGNVSPVTSGDVIIDTVAPERPAINTQGDLSPSASAALNGVPVVNRAEAADGIIIDGTAEANSLIELLIRGPNGFSLSTRAATDSNGQFSIPINVADLPAEQSRLSMSITSTDAAGNPSVPFVSDLIFDQTLSSAAVGVSSVADDIAPATGLVGAGGATNDTTPTIRGTVIGDILSDESVQVLRNGEVVGTAQLAGAIWSFEDNLNALAGGPQGQYNYTAQIIDDAGNAGNSGQFGAQSDPLTVLVDTTAPAQRVAITQVIDDTGRTEVIIQPGRATSDTTPSIAVSLDSVLEPGESLQLLRTQGGEIQLIGQADAAQSGQALDFGFEDLVVAGSPVTYQAQVVDSAGLAGVPSAVYVVSITDPLNNLP